MVPADGAASRTGLGHAVHVQVDLEVGASMPRMIADSLALLPRVSQEAAGSGTASAASASCSPRLLVARSATNAEASMKTALASNPR